MQGKADYDIVIIGAGAAGLSAGIYCSRAGLKTVILEKAVPGGQIFLSSAVENYPGLPETLTGPEIAENMRKQAEQFGAAIRTADVTDLDVPARAPLKTVRTAGGDVTTLAIIIASGARPRELGIPGERKFLGRGVSHCAFCDAFFFKDKDVVVVGGGNTAVQETLHLVHVCRKIYLVHRRDQLRAEHYLQVRLQEAAETMVYVWNSVPTAINGEETVASVSVKNLKTQEPSDIACSGVFIFIGYEPNTAFLRGKVPLDDEQHVVTDERMRTRVPGVFACGDVRNTFLQQMVVACGEGAVAAVSAYEYVQRLKGGESA